MSDPIRVDFPWHKTLAVMQDGVDYYCWKPGIRWEEGYQDLEAVADGVGAMLLTKIGRYTPPGYGSRVFYTRQFVLPSGEVVGRPKLRVMGEGGFTRLCRGYRYGYNVVDTLANVKMEDELPPWPAPFGD